MTLDQITPYSQWTPEQLMAASNSLGWNLTGNDDGNLKWTDGSEGGGGQRYMGENGPTYAGNTFSVYGHQLADAGYAPGGDYLTQYAQKLGLPLDQAIQQIYGQGSQLINDPTHGQLVKAGADQSQWKLPDMEDHSFLNNYGGALLMLPAAAGIAGVGAGAASAAGAGEAGGAGAAGTGAYSLGGAGSGIGGVGTGGIGFQAGSAGLGTLAPTSALGASISPITMGAGGMGAGTAALGGAASWGVNPISTASGASSLAKLFSGDASATDYAKLLGTLGAAGLGAYGANKAADSYGDLMGKYFDMGAPYRDLLKASYSPDFKPGDMAGFNDAIDSSMNATLRKLSTNGNPFDNPGGLMEANKYVTGNVALPAIQNYRSGLSAAGQLGTGQAATLGSNQIQSQSGVYDALGYGLGNLVNPPTPKDELLRRFQINNGAPSGGTIKLQ